MKIKIFVNDNGYPLGLETEINKWLLETKPQVVKILQSQTGNKTMITVMYH